ncbi:serine/threonine-protein kinase haspin homolog isoform X2 [Macadamia integrifolia]|uniref:serine/threonine-protein kinase haspin homolog isoform X2 n=1 Tax=Macadamia integrifolia TaxID=60698 RepID=UPI001C52AF00|nr:serine/threonine-protein kinase haspin homolog isoform X2 [Macadamia integrifolia]
MGTQRGDNGNDLWSEVAAGEVGKPQVAVIYRRRRAETSGVDAQISRSYKENRQSLAPGKRISWNRSLSTRGRTSVAISADVDYRGQLKEKEAKKKPKQPPHNRKIPKPSDYGKERAYFKEVDSFELLEESPSPKNFSTWSMGIQSGQVIIPDVATRLRKWLITRQPTHSCGSSSSLIKILETPGVHIESTCGDVSKCSNEKTPVMISAKKNDIEALETGDASSDDLGEAITKLTLTSDSASVDGNHHDSFSMLLRFCKQSSPSTLSDVFSLYCDPNSIVKIGEGTYGEAFKAGATVCKIVPFDGDLRVNGEVQKRASELLEEVVLSRTLNNLRGHHSNEFNSCTSFIETIDLRVCQGAYDPMLIRAWEEWDGKHGSENDHPKEFPENQITAALAVAEAAYEFEHRDLHWGNILLTRKNDARVQFTLEGKPMWAQTFGLTVSIIDFTLSRINTGESILFLDLSSDPLLFEGPKGDSQSETYRKMKEVTDECWEGSYPKTNVLWLQYLVDILLLKKSYKRTSKEERELRSLKKRLNSYSSTGEAITDAFFEELFVSVDDQKEKGGN